MTCRESFARFTIMKCNVPLMNSTFLTHRFYLKVVMIYSSENLTCNLGPLLMSFIYFSSQISQSSVEISLFAKLDSSLRPSNSSNDFSYLCLLLLPKHLTRLSLQLLNFTTLSFCSMLLPNPTAKMLRRRNNGEVLKHEKKVI